MASLGRNVRTRAWNLSGGGAIFQSFGPFNKGDRLVSAHLNYVSSDGSSSKISFGVGRNAAETDAEIKANEAHFVAGDETGNEPPLIEPQQDVNASGVVIDIDLPAVFVRDRLRRVERLASALRKGGSAMDITVLYGAIATLAGVVGYLHRQVEKRLLDCEKDREQLWQAVGHVASLQGEE